MSISNFPWIWKENTKKININHSGKNSTNKRSFVSLLLLSSWTPVYHWRLFRVTQAQKLTYYRLIDTLSFVFFFKDEIGENGRETTAWRYELPKLSTIRTLDRRKEGGIDIDSLILRMNGPITIHHFVNPLKRDEVKKEAFRSCSKRWTLESISVEVNLWKRGVIKCLLLFVG